MMRSIEAPSGPPAPDASLLDWLAGQGIDYELHEDPRNPAAAAAARAHGVRLVRTVVVLTQSEEPALIVVRDGDALDLAKVAWALRTPVARVASDEEARMLVPGRDPGAMPPIRELVRIQVYADHSIAGDRDIAFRSGSLERAVRLDRAVWEEISGVIYADFVQ